MKFMSLQENIRGGYSARISGEDARFNTESRFGMRSPKVLPAHEHYSLPNPGSVRT